ncbi:hypothetical protein [Tahibacter amnicola]|uniref:Ig-like domain-containing protein n=1 Tax=Tahibacter amnicola TaxID=2976241 RepID=A0ABY6BDF3_9GAMM|nr:hypothetical protein [Tahibacter amnicola]UXI67779.1 hypothetical protein N4264_24100 [Tahibacter amnicola]
MFMLPRYLAVAALLLAPVGVLTAAETKVDLVYANGSKVCTFTSNVDPAVSLSTDGSNAGRIRVVSNEANPFSGAGCPTAAPDTISVSAVSAPGTAQVGTAFNVSFTPSGNPDYCTTEGSTLPGSVTNWWPVSQSTQLCSGATCTTTVTRSVTASVAGSHVFGVRCYKATASNSPVSSATATTTVSTTPTENCPAPAGTRVGTATIWHFGATNQSHANADTRVWDQVFGWNANNNTPNAFPQLTNGVQINVPLSANQYYAIEFTVPQTVTNTFRYSFMTYDTSWQPAVGSGATPIAVAISKCPGAFNNNVVAGTVGANCALNMSPQGDVLGIAVNSAYTSRCILTRGERYYVNIVFADTSTPGTSNCTGQCKFSMRTSQDSAKAEE